MKNKKVVFMVTPLFSVPVLEMLIENTNVVLVVTQPDSFVGRKKELKYPPVKECAIKHNIPVFQPTKIRNEYEEILKYNPDIIITCAYGQIIPSILLDTPRYHAINVHASLLPKLRGGSPLHRAIINGYKETGITIMYMAPGMDDGDIITQKSIKIEETDFPIIKEVIQNASDNPKLAALRKKAREEAWMHIGESGKLTVDYMIKTVENNR